MSKVTVNLGMELNKLQNCIHSVWLRHLKIILSNNRQRIRRTLEIINEQFPHLKIIKHKENLGFAKACNQPYIE